MNTVKPNATDFAAFLEERAEKDDGYIMGATGQRPKTLSKTSWWFNQYDGRQHTKALWWREHAEFIWDCNGLAEGYCKRMTGVDINTYARVNYASWCDPKGKGKIPNDRKVPGAAVFYHNGSYVSHVGFLVRPVDPRKPDGDWYVVEARGVMYGVVTTKLSERSWNRWGWMTSKLVYDDEATAPVEYKLGGRVLRRGDDGEDVRQLQMVLISWGYDLGKWGADGDYGKDTETAVKAFQDDHDLPVTGVYGEADHAIVATLLDDENDNQTPDEPPVVIPPNLYPIFNRFPDISDNQGEIDYDPFCAGNDSCIARARVNGKNDGMFIKHAKAFNERNFPFSVYDYITLDSEDDAIKQADAMFERCNPYHPMIYFLDCEKLADGVDYKENRKYMGIYVNRLRQRGAKLVGLYTGSNRFENEYKRIAAIFDCLWIAHYGKNTGFLSNIPDSVEMVALHQYTSMGGATNKEGIRVPGVPGCKRRVDLNRLTGNKPLSFFTGRKHVGQEYFGAVRISVDAANVRSGAGKQFSRVGVAKKGELFALRDGSVRGWSAIYYKGSEAWVSLEVTKAVEE